MWSLAKGFLRKVCGNSLASSQKKTTFYNIAPGKGADILQRVAEISWKFVEKNC